MIRFLFRFLGLLGLAFAFIFLVYDGTKSIADRTLYITKLTDGWNAVYSKPPPEVLRPLIERVFADWMWDPLIVPLLNSPLWLVLAALSSLLILIGRRKRRLIGYARD